MLIKCLQSPIVSTACAIKDVKDVRLPRFEDTQHLSENTFLHTLVVLGQCYFVKLVYQIISSACTFINIVVPLVEPSLGVSSLLLAHYSHEGANRMKPTDESVYLLL